MASVAASIHSKSGRASASTKSGTTTTTASLSATAEAVSEVAVSRPAADDLAEVVGQVGLPGKRLGRRVHLLHDRALTSAPMTSCPRTANCTASGRPIFPRPTTVIRTLLLEGFG